MMTYLVRDIMTKSTVRISPNDSLLFVSQLMKERSIKHVLVTSEACQLVGIISDRDIKRFSSPFAGSKLESPKDRATLQLPVSHFMSKTLITVKPEDPVKKCVELLLAKGISALPVVDDDGVHGIVTTTNVLKLFLNFL
jgi:acetoin utilization protein AcuB